MLHRHRIVLFAFALFFLPPSVSHADTQGGYLTLSNATIYHWQISDVRNDRMRQWKFPSAIRAGTSATAYLEYADGDGFPSGEVTVSFKGSSYKFRILAQRTTANFTLKVELIDLPLSGYAQGEIIDVGFVPGGTARFMVAGLTGSFSTNFPRSAWMHDNLNVLGHRSLRHLTIPGSHDAGMSQITGGTFWPSACNTITQTLPVLEQLRKGVRYFDLRPVITGGKFSTGHYTHTSEFGWQGKNGQTLDSIIADVNTYTAANRELIILHFSHDLNTDTGRTYRAFTQSEWGRLLVHLSRLHHRFVSRNPRTVDLTTLRLAEFIGSNPAVVIVAQPANPNVTIGPLSPDGVYTIRNFPIFDEYSATNDLRTMMHDQLAKLRAQRSNPDAGYFLLSWTLTQSESQVALCSHLSPFVDSILDLAHEANPRLYDSLLPSVDRWTYPNVLYIDAVESSDIVGLAMAVTGIAARATPQGYVIYKGQGADTGIYVGYTWSSNLSNGSTWRLTRMSGAINTSDTPGTVSFGGRVHVLYKGSGNDTKIYVAQTRGYNMVDGPSWNANRLNPAINTSTAPRVAVFRGTPYMLYKGAGTDTNVYIARSAGNRVGDGSSWSASRLNPGINTSDAPAIAEFGGLLYLFYKGSGDSNIWIGRSTGDVFDGNSWTANRLNPGIRTSTAPGVVVYNGDLYVFYKGPGTDTNIYVARASGVDVFDGTQWEYARLNPGINTTAAPRPIVIGDSLYLFYKGSGDDNIWIAEPYGPDLLDGDFWSWERLHPSINTSTGPGAAVTW